MALNYTKLQATAERLIRQSGRVVTFVQIDQFTDDPSKPWRGVTADRESPTVTLEKRAVFVEPNTNIFLGETIKVDDLLKNVNKIMVVDGVDNLDGFHEVVEDDGSRWRIEFIYRLRPGELTMVNYVGVRR